MKIPVAVKILNEATGPKANVEFMDVSIPERKALFCRVGPDMTAGCSSMFKKPWFKAKTTSSVFYRSSEVII